MFSLEKLTRLLQVQIMIKECNELIRQKHMRNGSSKDLVSNKEKIKCNNIIKQYKK